MRKPSRVRSIAYAVAFLGSVVLGLSASLTTGEAWDFQRDNLKALNGYYMHQWLIDEEQATNRRFRNGMDSRYSWGGSYRHMGEFRMQPARAWMCGVLKWSYTISMFDAYYLSKNSPWLGYPACGPQGDFTARFYQYGLVNWWPYLNF